MMRALAAILASTSSVSAQQAIEVIVRGEDVLPSLEEVQRAAVDALELDPSTQEAWATRARWRALAPRLELVIGSDADVDVRDSWTGELRRTTTEGRALGVEIGSRWELGELIFSESELRANREALARASAMLLARDRATELYFDRVAVLLELRQTPSPSLALKAARLDGLIRALTGGRIEEKKRGETR